MMGLALSNTSLTFVVLDWNKMGTATEFDGDLNMIHLARIHLKPYLVYSKLLPSL